MEIASLKLTTEQKMIMKSRFIGKSFWEIPEDLRRHTTDEIIIAASAITGAGLPETELLGKYLSEEIVELITNYGYEDLTVEEIISAIRINVTNMIKNPNGEDLPVVELPHRVCTNFLGGVLRNYKILRNGLDRLIEIKLLA